MLVNVGVFVGVNVGVDVSVGVLVGVRVGVEVNVGVRVGVNVGVEVRVGDGVGVGVGIALSPIEATRMSMLMLDLPVITKKDVSGLKLEDTQRTEHRPRWANVLFPVLDEPA